MHQSNGKLRIGVLGAGRVSRDLHIPVLVNIPNVSIAWLCDKNEPRARQLAKDYKIPSVFGEIEKCSNVDIVLVAIPVGYRPPVMKHIFQRGWHVFCEKPFALTAAEYLRYLTDARERKVQVGVGMVRRFGAATLMTKKIVHEGYFGPIKEVWAYEGNRTKRTGQESNWYMSDPKIAGGGVLMETGSHLVDQLCTILNVDQFEIKRCIQRQLRGLEFETEFVGAVSTDRQSELRCTFTVSRLKDLCNGIFLRFSDFTLKCGLFFEDPLELCTLEGAPIARLDIQEGAKTIAQGFYLEWKDFIEQCLTGNKSAIDAESVRIPTALIEQCYKNAEVIDVCTTL
jgi:predicted dehydrogenase